MIQTGLEQSDWFLVVLSPNAIESEWVKAEVGWAMVYRKGKVIPILHKDCEAHKVHLLLWNIQHLRFEDDSPETKMRVASELSRVGK